MNIELTSKEFRRLLDLVYIGNWILNSTRENDRFEDYDLLEEKIFAMCKSQGMKSLIQVHEGRIYPSHAYQHGGIHEAIADYEDAIFFEILAEELARRDMDYVEISPDKYDELTSRMDAYIAEFERNGVENILIENM